MAAYRDIKKGVLNLYYKSMAVRHTAWQLGKSSNPLKTAGNCKQNKHERTSINAWRLSIDIRPMIMWKLKK